MLTQDQQILAARQKHRVWVFILAGCAGLILVLYLSWLFLAKGYQLDVAPEEAAAVAKFRVKSGPGFLLGNKLYSFGSNLTLTVSAKKYIDRDVVVTANSPGVISIVLQPAPVALQLLTTPAQADTQWYINGELVASNEELVTNVPPGEIVITAVHPWFESAQKTITAGPGENVNDTIQLTPVKGRLSINSVPSGATVTIDNEPVGSTPLELERPGGNYAVQVARVGYQTTTDTIAVELGNRQPQRNYQLLPEQAKLNFTLKPEGGVLLVNLKPVAGELMVDANTKHTIRYEKAGFAAFNQILSLTPGETEHLEITLKPEFAEVALQSNLPAEIKINGKSYGTTPLNLKLQTFEQDIEFIRPGYRTVVKTITPKAEKTLQVSAEMLSEFDARRKEGKPLFVASLGIQMKSFQPTAYVMGSPENEAFRRRNEHPLSVSFNRRIWVSKHEITEAQFVAFRQSASATGDLPVTNISWSEAAEFCHWLSVKEGLEPFYLFENGRLSGVNVEARGYRLPSEAEWEWLAKVSGRRAPTQYSWGSQERIPKDYGNYADASIKANNVFKFENYNDGFAGKAPVGSFKADRNGLFDLDGNVAEWVHDRFTLQPPDLNQTQLNYLGANRGTTHVVKGGHYETGRLRELRVALREEGSEPSATIGFRIARYE